jgi:hypothetical protein
MMAHSGAQIAAWNPTEVPQKALLKFPAQSDSTIAKVPEE